MCILFWHLFFITFVTNSQHLAEKWQQKRRSVKRTPKGEARRTSMKVTAWFKNAFVRLKLDRRKAGKEKLSTLLIGSRRCGAFKRKFNFIWHWLLSFRPISDGCCCRSGLVQSSFYSLVWATILSIYRKVVSPATFLVHFRPKMSCWQASKQRTHMWPHLPADCNARRRKRRWRRERTREKWEYWCFWHAFVHNFAITINKCEDWARKN